MSAKQRIETESHKDPDTLEREIESKRREISGIVDELEHKLSPGEIFDRVVGFARGNGGEFFSNFGATIRANPVPAVLTSVGLLWMMSSQREPHYYDRAYQVDVYGTNADGRSKVGEAASSLKNKAAHARDSMSDTMHGASARVRDAGHRLSDAGHQISDRSHRAAEAVRHSAHGARQSFEDMLHEQPLAAGAIGVAVGALLAAMLPSTRREDELLGDVSDRTRDEVRQRAEQGIEQGLDRAEQRLQQGEADTGQRSGGGNGRYGSAPPESRPGQGF